MDTIKGKGKKNDGEVMDLKVTVKEVQDKLLVVDDGTSYQGKGDKVWVKSPHKTSNFKVDENYAIKVVVNEYEAHGRTCKGLLLDSYEKVEGSLDAVRQAIKEDSMSKDDWTAKERREYLDKAINTILSKPDITVGSGMNAELMEGLFNWAKEKVNSLFFDPIADTNKQEAEKEQTIESKGDNTPF